MLNDSTARSDKRRSESPDPLYLAHPVLSPVMHRIRYKSSPRVVILRLEEPVVLLPW